MERKVCCMTHRVLGIAQRKVTIVCPEKNLYADEETFFQKVVKPLGRKNVPGLKPKNSGNGEKYEFNLAEFADKANNDAATLVADICPEIHKQIRGGDERKRLIESANSESVGA